MFETQIKEKVRSFANAITVSSTLKLAITIGLFLIIAVLLKVDSTHELKSGALASETPLQERFSGGQVLGQSIDLRGKEPEVKRVFLPGIIDDSDITAKSYLLADAKTGRILLEKLGRQKRSIASLTKLLTGLVAYEKLQLNEYLTVGTKDVLDISPSLHLQAGDSVQVWDLLNAMLVGSGNDAALALANHVSEQQGDNFVKLMNKKASQLSMQDSNFSNPMGFERGENYSTAEDLLKLVLETQKLAAFTSLGKTTSYSFSGNQRSYSLPATNKLLNKYPQFEAVKTGFTEAAGGALITKSTRGSRSIYIIVLGSGNREQDTVLLEKRFFERAVWED